MEKSLSLAIVKEYCSQCDVMPQGLIWKGHKMCLNIFEMKWYKEFLFTSSSGFVSNVERSSSKLWAFFLKILPSSVCNDNNSIQTQVQFCWGFCSWFMVLYDIDFKWNARSFQGNGCICSCRHEYWNIRKVGRFVH